MERASRQRVAVSAEVYGKFNLQKEYTPPVHQKTPQQIEAIKQKMSGNFMFDQLNPKDKKAILDAVKAVQKKKDEIIIK